MQPLISLDPRLAMNEVFGFSELELRDQVVSRASAASRSYSIGLYPTGAAGSVRYFHTVANLRQAFAPLGYRPDDSDQVARTLHVDRGIAIITAAGNELTGLPPHLGLKEPATRWPKGPTAHRAIASNNAQIALFNIPETENDRDQEPKSISTWILLQHANADEVRSELSLPCTINPRGFVTRWERRFILPPLPNNGGPTYNLDDDDEMGGDIGIDVFVEPR